MSHHASLSAATYYIDYAGGADTNNGTSTATPWQRHPYMNGFAGTYTHQAGDQFIFKGGVTWPNSCFQMNPVLGGSLGAIDYYGVDHAWFSGASFTRPKFDFSGSVSTTARIYLSNISYATFDNIEFYGLVISDGSAWPPIADIFVYGGSEVTISNCYAHGWSVIGTNDENDAEFYFLSHAGGEVSSCIIDGSDSLVNGYGSTRAIWGAAIVKNNTIRYVPNGMGLNGDAQGNDIGPIVRSINPLMHGNALYEFGSGRVYNNIVHDVWGDPVNGGGYPVIYVEAAYNNVANTTYVYNNLVYDTSMPCISLEYEFTDSQLDTHTYVYNNTLVSGNNYAISAVDRGVNNRPDHVEFSNNHIISDAVAPVNTNYILDLYVGNNLIQSTVQATASGYTIANQFQPTSGNSSTVDAGVSYSSIFTTDISGVSRPQGSAWDIGAYEYVPPIYISQNGTGTQSGADASDTLPVSWFNNSSNWGTNTGQIGPGVTVHMCGIISTPLTVQGSGVAGNPITIYFEPNAVMSAPAFTTAINATGSSYITIDGGQNGIIQNTDNGTPGSINPNTGLPYGNQVNSTMIQLQYGSNQTVQNLTISNIYVRTPYSTDANAFGCGIWAQGSNIVMRNNTITHGCSLIVQSYSTGLASNLTIDSNTLLATNHAITVGSGGQVNPNYSNITISNNHIDGMDVWDAPGGDLGFHRNGIIMFCQSPDGSGSISNVNIYGNYIGPGFNPQPSQSDTAGTSAIFLDVANSQCQNFSIYNNLFSLKSPISWADGYICGCGTNILIANNTFIGWGEGGYITTSGPGAKVYNNILYNTAFGLYLRNIGDDGNPFPMSSILSDNNLFYGLNPNGPWDFAGTAGTYDNLAQWQSLTGWDLNSITSDPLLVNGSPSNGDYQLTSSSPAIGAGANLTQYCSQPSPSDSTFIMAPTLGTDYAGNPRPATGPWDIGAYEYQAGGSIIYGDVSGDGTVDAYDAALVAQYSVGLITFTQAQQQAANVDGSGNISAYDAALIAQYSVGLITKFPVE